MTDLNLPALSESDPGKPIKASWGDRVVEAIQANNDSIVGLGIPNSVFGTFHGDGSDGNLDVTTTQTINVPLAGLQYEDLTVRAGVILTFNCNALTANGIARIGVFGTLTMEAGAIITVTGQGYSSGAGGAGGTGGADGMNGSIGGGNYRLGIGMPTAGGGGGGSGDYSGNSTYTSGSGSTGGSMLGALGGSGGAGRDTFANGGHGAAGNLGFWTQARWWGDYIVPHQAPGGGGGGGGRSPGTGSNGGAGGNGGIGGGWLILEVNEIDIDASATLASNGGAGGNGGNHSGYASGGGGGGGGAAGGILLLYLSQVALTSTPVIAVSGGSGGSGGSGYGGYVGGSGGAGRAGIAAIAEVGV